MYLPSKYGSVLGVTNPTASLPLAGGDVGPTSPTQRPAGKRLAPAPGTGAGGWGQPCFARPDATPAHPADTARFGFPHVAPNGPIAWLQRGVSHVSRLPLGLMLLCCSNLSMLYSNSCQSPLSY